MDLVNATKMQAGFTLGMEPSGREHVVVVVKGTFAIPRAGEEPTLAEDQAPLVMADTLSGEPGFSATIYESEFARVKPRCDVLLNGSAYAPGGKPAERVLVSLRLGTIKKSFAVVGDRVWKSGFFGERASAIEPFTRMPISYDRAWGGAHPSEKNPEQMMAFADNPVGRGFYDGRDGKLLEGRPLPNTEETRDAVSSPRGKYRPMAFGALPRSVPARLRYAGTYDKTWEKDHFPFLPPDFDVRYFQAAPEDQQIAYPQGGEEVELINLTPAGRTVFRLPAVEVPVEFTTAAVERIEKQAVLDTILLEPDLGRMLLIWRASLPLRRDLFEVPQAVVGRMPAGWYRARDARKEFRASIAATGRDPGARAGEAR